MRLPVNHALALTALVLLTGCLPGGDRPEKRASMPPAAVGPAADYPMVIGEPFTIGETAYRPEDRLNYDAVGRAAIGTEGGEAVSISHKTLPLPSYAEVTSLETGRTILVRVERRGPMSNDRLVELSPGAAAQLGLLVDGTPIRIRRVNPPEPERALLRAGARATERMETPKPLVAVLLRRLNGSGTINAALPVPARSAEPSPTAKPAEARPANRQPAPPAPTVAPGNLEVQVGAFSTRERAERAAASVSGNVVPAGKLFRVRIGPLATQVEAEAALAKARSAGYSDARIQRIR